MLQKAYNKLAKIDKEALMIAFNEQETYIVFFKNKTFIGVWIVPSEELVVVEEKNNWYFGRRECP